MKVYANLIGNWIDITDCATMADCQKPVDYINEHLTYAEGSNVADRFKYDYVHIQYDGKDYRIHPSLIQIVND